MKSLLAGTASSFFRIFSLDQGEEVDVAGGEICDARGPCASFSSYNRCSFSIRNGLFLLFMDRC